MALITKYLALVHNYYALEFKPYWMLKKIQNSVILIFLSEFKIKCLDFRHLIVNFIASDDKVDIALRAVSLEDEKRHLSTGF